MHAEITDAVELGRQIPQAKNLLVAVLPDITHHAATVAGAVSMDHKNGNGSQGVRIVVPDRQRRNGCGFMCQAGLAFRRGECRGRDGAWFVQKGSRGARESNELCHRWTKAEDRSTSLPAVAFPSPEKQVERGQRAPRVQCREKRD